MLTDLDLVALISAILNAGDLANPSFKRHLETRPHMPQHYVDRARELIRITKSRPETP